MNRGARLEPPGIQCPLIQYEVPDGQSEKDNPREQRKTYCGLQDCAALAAELDGVRPVSLMDREADVFALFVERRSLGSVDLLVRARYNRSAGPGRAEAV